MLGDPFVPDVLTAKLCDLWDEYHIACETYDRTVCTGPITERDGIMPATYKELGLINRNAHIQYKIFRDKAQALGATPELIADVKRRHVPRSIPLRSNS